MLSKLHIKNYAIVEELTIDFAPGLNVITGETGAGKSILIGALSLLMGERAQTEMIRTGADGAVVEGEFILPSAPEWAVLRNEFNAGESRPVCVRREVNRRGSSRCFVNDRLVTLSELKSFGDLMGDLCGQHQHQSLLDPRSHIRFLDERAELREQAEAFREAYGVVVADQRQLDEITRRADQRRQAHELARFQVEEIRRAGVTVDEEDELKRELNVLKNARRLIEAGEQAAAVLAEEEGSAADRVARVRKEFLSLAEIDDRLGSTVDLLEKCEVQLADIVSTIGDYCRRIDFDPNRTEEIEARLAEIFQLKGKYGPSCAAILARLAELEAELTTYHTEDDRKAELVSRLEDNKRQLAVEADKLSKARRAASVKLGREVTASLSRIGMAGAKFRVDFTPVGSGSRRVPFAGTEVAVTENGLEEIEFAIETNPGEGYKPLVKIASGGELSRVMLAIKAAGQPGHDVSLLVFDEVDSGIGGTVAFAVARQIKKLAQHYQVFLISHLHQMASLADQHYLVSKQKSGKRIATQIRLLDKSERVEEIARMMASAEITETTRLHAAEMVDPAGKSSVSRTKN